MKPQFHICETRSFNRINSFTSWSAADKFAKNYITNTDKSHSDLVLVEHSEMLESYSGMKSIKRYFWDSVNKKVISQWY